MRLAVIPARGGSKRIPRKNIRPFCGRPMIGWAIEAARGSGLFERIIVSTDDAEIMEAARALGAQAPFVRPPEISDDKTPTVPVVAHAVAWAQESGLEVEAACCIYATAAFAEAGDIRTAYGLLGDGVDYAFPVTAFAAPIQRAFRLLEGERVRMFEPQHFTARSQDLEPAYHDAGQFYWGRPEAWLARRPIFSENARALVIPHWRVQDIDTPDDWVRAEALFRALRQGEAS